MRIIESQLVIGRWLLNLLNYHHQKKRSQMDGRYHISDMALSPTTESNSSQDNECAILKREQEEQLTVVSVQESSTIL